MVGAYALAGHGLPRATGAIDLWVRPTPENAERVMATLARFGAPLAGVGAADFATPGVVMQFGVAPRRVDILTAIDAVDFDEAWPARFEAEIERMRIGAIGREHLLLNKQASGRPKDLADVVWLEGRDNA